MLGIGFTTISDSRVIPHHGISSLFAHFVVLFSSNIDNGMLPEMITSTGLFGSKHAKYMVHEEDASGEHTRDKRNTQLAIVILWIE